MPFARLARYHVPGAVSVAARADKGGVTLPFLFRTYDCREDEPAGSKNPPLNAGRAAPCSIIEVGRATVRRPIISDPLKSKIGASKDLKRRRYRSWTEALALTIPATRY
jgi:hypothetical protein